MNKIQNNKTNARTRLVMLSNPRSNRGIGTYAFGVQAILELLGAPEDVRRLDFALVMAKADVEAAVVNSTPPIVDHVYTSDLCHRLVLWAWTRPKLVIAGPVWTLIRQKATELSEKYTDSIPLVDRGSMRMKLARLAGALAYRTFSEVVRPCHVEWIVNFIDRTYSSPSMGYADLSRNRRRAETLDKRSELIKFIRSQPRPRLLIEFLLNEDLFNNHKLGSWFGMDPDGVRQFTARLFLHRAIRAAGKDSYAKATPFVALLKELEQDETVTDPPEFLAGESDEDF